MQMEVAIKTYCSWMITLNQRFGKNRQYALFVILPLGLLFFIVLWSYTSEDRRPVQQHRNNTQTHKLLRNPELCPVSNTKNPGFSEEEYEQMLKAVQWSGPDCEITHINQSTSSLQTTFIINDFKDSYYVGEELHVTIVAKDWNGVPKRYGGDFFQAKVYSDELKASVFGEVLDHQNGTYLARFTLPWTGMASVAIRLIHSSEAVQVLKAFQDKDLNRISFYGFFVARDSQGEPVEEKVMCNIKWEGVVLPSSSAQGNCCCEYHDVRTQLTWQCLKPPTLPCNTLVYHSMGEFSGSMTQIEGALTDKEIVDKWLIGDTRLINIAASDKTMRVTEPCLPGMPTPVPAGFYLNDVWTPFQCNLRQFTSDGITQCLSGKHIYITGDSTTRQWYYFFTENVPTLHEVDLHAMSWTGPFMAVDLQNNINLYYHPHGLPLRCGKAPVVTFQYLSNQIDNIAGGPHTVFILTMWAHFLNYPLSYYSYRVWLVRRAVVSLLRRAPETKVVIKTANTGFKDFYTGDWYAKQLDRILLEAFRGINVYILDVWQMTACHYSSDDLHPQPVVIQNEMNILLSYICPN